MALEHHVNRAPARSQEFGSFINGEQSWQGHVVSPVRRMDSITVAFSCLSVADNSQGVTGSFADGQEGCTYAPSFQEDHMGRRDRDEERPSDAPAPEPGRDDGRVRAVTIRDLPDQLTRDRHPNLREREHHLTLPSGPDREPVRDGARLYHLRGTE